MYIKRVRASVFWPDSRRRKDEIRLWGWKEPPKEELSTQREREKMRENSGQHHSTEEATFSDAKSCLVVVVREGAARPEREREKAHQHDGNGKRKMINTHTQVRLVMASIMIF